MFMRVRLPRLRAYPLGCLTYPPAYLPLNLIYVNLWSDVGTCTFTRANPSWDICTGHSIHTPDFNYVNLMVKCWDLYVYVSKYPIWYIIHALGYISYRHLNLIMQI